MIAVAIAALVAMIGVGVWWVLPGLKNRGQTASQVVVVQGAVPQVGLRQFEAALTTPHCSWLQIAKIAPGPTGVDLAITGIAASPMEVQSALQAAAGKAKVPVADIDLQSIAAATPTLCPALDAFRPFRAATSQSGQNLTAAQDSFAVMKQADGKEAGRAIVTVTPPPQGDFALAQLSADGGLSVVAANRQAFQALASAGVVVSKVPDAGGYRLQADYAKPGWSSVLLITGQGPFPPALLTQPAGPRSAAWASQFAAAAARRRLACRDGLVRDHHRRRPQRDPANSRRRQQPVRRQRPRCRPAAAAADQEADGDQCWRGGAYQCGRASCDQRQCGQSRTSASIASAARLPKATGRSEAKSRDLLSVGSGEQNAGRVDSAAIRDDNNYLLCR